MLDYFFEIAKSEAYKKKFHDQFDFDEEVGREYYREKNLRKVMRELRELAENTGHSRNKMVIESTAARIKIQISHAIWLEDMSNDLINKGKTPADLIV